MWLNHPCQCTVWVHLVILPYWMAKTTIIMETTLRETSITAMVQQVAINNGLIMVPLEEDLW